MNIYLKTLIRNPEAILHLMFGSAAHLKALIFNRSNTITNKEYLLELAASDAALDVLEEKLSRGELRDDMTAEELIPIWEAELNLQRTNLKK